MNAWLRQILFLSLVLGVNACQTTKPPPSAEKDDGRVYMRGVGIAKYHHYDGVSKCKTAYGLDPDAFDEMVTAISLRIADKFPKLVKVGKRGGPYDPTSRCVRVIALGSRKSIVVRAIDKCCGGSLSSPATHQLDLSLKAFEALAPKELGNLKIEWRLVDCPKELQVTSDSDVCDDGYYFGG